MKHGDFPISFLLTFTRPGKPHPISQVQTWLKHGVSTSYGPPTRIPVLNQVFSYNVRPPSDVCWLTKAPVTIVINTINHIVIGVINQLNAILGASHCRLFDDQGVGVQKVRYKKPSRVGRRMVLEIPSKSQATRLRWNVQRSNDWFILN